MLTTSISNIKYNLVWFDIHWMPWSLIFSMNPQKTNYYSDTCFEAFWWNCAVDLITQITKGITVSSPLIKVPKPNPLSARNEYHHGLRSCQHSRSSAFSLIFNGQPRNRVLIRYVPRYKLILVLRSPYKPWSNEGFIHGFLRGNVVNIPRLWPWSCVDNHRPGRSFFSLSILSFGVPRTSGIFIFGIGW